MRALIEELPADQASVIELAYYGGSTHTKIAGMLDVPIATLKGRIRLALEKLRCRLATPAALS